MNSEPPVEAAGRERETTVPGVLTDNVVDASLNLTTTTTPRKRPPRICVSSSVKGMCPQPLLDKIEVVNGGFEAGKTPERATTGTSGVYFLTNENGAKVAVLKPSDEETTLHEGITVGEGALREVAAYILDHGGFSGVLPTTLVEASHPDLVSGELRSPIMRKLRSLDEYSSDTKVGSLQEFMSNNGIVEGIGHGLIRVDEAHKIAVLDLRLLNSDRNSGNVLYKKEKGGVCTLIPIDHGFSLRSTTNGLLEDLCWVNWPQMEKPMSDQTKAFIESLDIQADANALLKLGITGMALVFFIASSTFLQIGTSAGLTLRAMATFCYRADGPDINDPGRDPSGLELNVFVAVKLATVILQQEDWDASVAFTAVCSELRSSEECGELASSSLTPPCLEWAGCIVTDAIESSFESTAASDALVFGTDSKVFRDYFSVIFRLLVASIVEDLDRKTS